MSDVTGGCLCGGVRYRCDDPVGSLVLCACRSCRYTTGGQPNAATMIRASAIRITGEVNGYTSPGGSGQPMTRHFCPVCGTPIYTSLSTRLDTLLLRAGTLDDQQALKVVARIWTSALEPWHTIDEGTPGFPTGFPEGGSK